jgi:hypothetical protein
MTYMTGCNFKRRFNLLLYIGYHVQWNIEPPTHGILTPLPMVYRPPYPWYIEPLTHGISTPLSMVFCPPTHRISTPLHMIF